MLLYKPVYRNISSTVTELHYMTHSEISDEFLSYVYMTVQSLCWLKLKSGMDFTVNNENFYIIFHDLVTFIQYYSIYNTNKRRMFNQTSPFCNVQT